MGRLLLTGPDSDRLLDHLIPSQAATQPPGKSFYTLLLNEKGGIKDDLIALKKAANDYLLVVNAANTSKDLEHIKKQAKGFSVTISDTTAQSTMIAVQGPGAGKTLKEVISINLDGLKRFRFTSHSVEGHHSLISRTGYTGEDGFELIIEDSGTDNPQFAMKIWKGLTDEAAPCGLGARDSLRLEAGISLYGLDIDEDTNPFDADISWVVSMEKQDFVGRSALDKLKNQRQTRIRRGLVLDEKIPRAGFEILNSNRQQIGRVTSGTFSPIIKRGIALGYVSTEYSEPGTPVEVKVRDSNAKARVARPPFYDETLYGWKRRLS